MLERQVSVATANADLDTTITQIHRGAYGCGTLSIDAWHESPQGLFIGHLFRMDGIVVMPA